MSRLEGSRWRLRWAREMPLAMEFEWGFFRPLFGAKRGCGHFQDCGGERQIPPHTWRIISRAASAAPAASCLPTIRELGARLKYNQTYCRRGPLYTVRPGARVHRGRVWTSASNAFALNSGKLSLSRKNWCLTTSVRATVTCAE